MRLLRRGSVIPVYPEVIITREILRRIDLVKNVPQFFKLYRNGESNRGNLEQQGPRWGLEKLIKALTRRFCEREHTVGCSDQLVKVGTEKKEVGKSESVAGRALFFPWPRNSHVLVVFTCQHRRAR